MAKKISRRALGLASLGAAALGAAAAPPQEASGYTGPLDGFKDKVPLDAFDSLTWTRRRYEQAPLAMTYQAGGQRRTEAWQNRLREKLVDLLGGFPPDRVPLSSETLEVREFPSYRREKFIFESRPALYVLGYLLTPKNLDPPYRTMICVPGHGRGVDDLVGIDEKGADRAEREFYQYDFAIQAVEKGMAALAIEPLGFGCRRDPKSRERGLKNSSCQPSAGAALLFGETMIGWRVYDVMRAIDWIETRDDLEANRVGCMGISGGGTCTTFSAALEPRIKVAYISGYLNTFRDSILSISHCIDNYVPGILKWCEMYDVAGLIAPRPLFIESGDKDNIFPVEASIASFEKVKKVYEAFERADLAEQEVFAGEHKFWGVRGLPFVARHL